MIRSRCIVPADPGSSINAPSVARGVRHYGATASSSSLSPLLNANDREHVDSEANDMGSKDLEPVDSKAHQEDSEDAPGLGYGLSGLQLTEAEGRTGFSGLFQNTLV